MATDAGTKESISSKVAQTVNRLLECGICFERKEFRVLPCQHLICSDCLTQICMKKGESPICSYCSAKLPDKPTKEYPTLRVTKHFQRNRESIIASLEKACSGQCQADISCSSPSVHFCKHCNKALCQKCGREKCVVKPPRHDKGSLTSQPSQTGTKLKEWQSNHQQIISSLNDKRAAIIDDVRICAQQLSEAKPNVIEELLSTTVKSLSQGSANLKKVNDNIVTEKATLTFVEALTEHAEGLELLVIHQQLQNYDLNRKMLVGDFESLVTGNQYYDVAWSPKGHLLAARGSAIDIFTITGGTAKLIKSLATSGRVFTLVVRETEIVAAITSEGLQARTDVIIYNLSYEEVRRWSARTSPCDFTVVGDSIVFSNTTSCNLRRYSLDGRELPEIIWNGTSAGIVGLPSGSIILADEMYNKVYQKQMTGGKILWTADVIKPFSLCIDSDECVWIRSNRNDCVTVISSQGQKLQEIMDDKFTKLGEWLGIMVHDGFLYATHGDGIGRFSLSYDD